MAAHDIVVIGASAGGVDATRSVLSQLPADFPAAVFIALHRPPVVKDRGLLDRVLTRDSALVPRIAMDGQRFHHGEVYVAPPDVHLLVERGAIRLERGPKEIMARPSVDVLFRSAALAYGRRVAGVVLTGTLTDGTLGLWQIRKHGGIAIVQDPREAAHHGMPRYAMEHVPVHHCLRLRDIAPALIELAGEQPSAPRLSGPRSARLLIVEDERVVAMDLANRLRELGYVVVGSVASGEKAIAAAAELMPDLVLMDVSLAGSMRGTDAAHVLWEQYQLPVVYLTAYADDATLDQAKMSINYGYVVKPYRPEQVHAAIQVALDRYDREMAVS
jgi:chemotaxis response regulator CheB